jgi:predicted regulator of Ras-like GTPase activity (Roadblock/LC7/MglB family)
VAATVHDLALRYLLELSADIHGALLAGRDGALVASQGNLASAGLKEAAAKLAAETGELSRNGRGDAAVSGHASVEVDVLTESGALFVLGEADLVMACVTSRSVNPGLIFYDMHAVLRDLERAAAAEARRERESVPRAAAANRGQQ